MTRHFLLMAASGLGVSFVLAGALLEREPGPPELPPLACPALAPRIATADRIELTHAGQTLWLERRGMVWGLARQGGYPAQPGRVDALIQGLLGLRILKPAPGTLDALGLADPFQPSPAGGTFVRLLATSGAVLCTVITGPNKAVRRPADTTGWLANAQLADPPDLDNWSQHALPPLDASRLRAVLADGGLGSAAVATMVAALPFTDVRPRPQIHPTPVRTIELALTDGTAVLTVGMEAGQPWLSISGTSPWAMPLTPFAFALPQDSPLAAS